MAHSNSSINQYLDCEKKYELNYIQHKSPPTPPSIHLTFGTMAHEVLYKAGIMRDANVIDYETCIPSDLAYPQEAAYFKITNWWLYFRPIINEVASIESELLKEFNACSIEREKKLSLSAEELQNAGFINSELPYPSEPLVGVIDLLLHDDNKAIIVDYKFSTKRKDQDDFDMNSQLYIYALFVHLIYDIPLHHIQIAYIDIPKQMFEYPPLLSTGKLSRAKSLNVSKEMYIEAVKAVHGEEAEAMLAPGGYYHDIVDEFALNKPAYLSKQYLDTEIFVNVISDVVTAAQLITFKEINKTPFLRKLDSYSCKNCDWKSLCKPYLTEVFGGKNDG